MQQEPTSTPLLLLLVVVVLVTACSTRKVPSEDTQQGHT
jgi:hypothetical protein